MLRGDSPKSSAIAGREVFRIVESSISIKIAVAKIIGRIFLTCGITGDWDILLKVKIKKQKWDM